MVDYVHVLYLNLNLAHPFTSLTLQKSPIVIPGHLRDGQVADGQALGAQLEAAAVARPRRAHPLRGLVRLQLQDRLGVGGLQIPRLGPVRPSALQLRSARLPGYRCILVGRWTGMLKVLHLKP